MPGMMAGATYHTAGSSMCALGIVAASTCIVVLLYVFFEIPVS